MIDWHEVIIILRRHYRKDYLIAQSAGCHQKMIGDLATGKQKEPRFTLGVRLLDMAYDANDAAFLKRIMA